MRDQNDNGWEFVKIILVMSYILAFGESILYDLWDKKRLFFSIQTKAVFWKVYKDET